MLASLSIAKRDFKGFFGTSMGWIAACIIFLVSGILFYIVTRNLLSRGSGVDPVNEIMSSLCGFLNYINIFIVPIFTMRVMSEELSTGTYRLQAAAPIGTGDIVFGKFLGILYYFMVIGLLMLIYPMYVFIFATPDWRVMASAWLGFILNIAAVVSIGMFIGSLTKNAVISYLGSVFFIILVLFSCYMKGVPDWYQKSVNLLELSSEFTKGMIKTTSLSIYLAVVSIFLFLSRMVLETNRWKV